MFIRLPAEATKEKKARNIPINHHVKETLDNLPRALGHDYVFTHKGQPFRVISTIKKCLIGACKKADISYGRETTNGFIFHDIRRTVKTNMLNAGIDKAHRDMLLGHSLQGMDIHYLVSTEESLTQAMNQYTEWLDSKLANAFASVDHPVDQT